MTDLFDDGRITTAKAWATFSQILNVGELLDEFALAARADPHAKTAYELLERAADGAIPSLKRTLFVLDARMRP